MYIFNFSSYFQKVLQNGDTNLHSSKLGLRVLLAPHPWQHCTVNLILLPAISCMQRTSSGFSLNGWASAHSHVWWLFRKFLLWNGCSFLFSAFLLCYLSFPYWFMGILYICWVRILSGYLYCKYLLPACALRLSSLDGIFWGTRVASFIFNLSNFPLQLVLFVFCLRNYCPYKMTKTFSLLSFRIFIALSFRFKFTTREELILVTVWSGG